MSRNLVVVKDSFFRMLMKSNRFTDLFKKHNDDKLVVKIETERSKMERRTELQSIYDP